VLELAATRYVGAIGEKGVRGHGWTVWFRLKGQEKMQFIHWVSIARNFPSTFPSSIKSSARHHRAFEAAGEFMDELRFATGAKRTSDLVTGLPEQIRRSEP